MGIRRRMKTIARDLRFPRRAIRRFSFYECGDYVDCFMYDRLPLDPVYVDINRPDAERDLLVLSHHIGKGRGSLETAKRFDWEDPRVKEAYLAVPSKAKLFWTGENTELKCHAMYDDYCLGSVDLSLGFKRWPDSPRYIHFPLWIFYLFGSCLTAGAVRRRIDSINAARSTGKRFCALIANHDMAIEYAVPKNPAPPTGVRTRLRSLAAEFGEVSCPSLLYHNDDTLKTVYGDDKLAYLRDFKFTICPENSIGDGYCTEKLFHAFAAGCIPIYWGAPRAELAELVNADAILYFDGTNERQIAKELARLDSDERYCRAFNRQPKLLPSLIDFVDSRFALLEGRLKEMLSL